MIDRCPVEAAMEKEIDDSGQGCCPVQARVGEYCNVRVVHMESGGGEKLAVRLNILHPRQIALSRPSQRTWTSLVRSPENTPSERRELQVVLGHRMGRSF